RDQAGALGRVSGVSRVFGREGGRDRGASTWREWPEMRKFASLSAAMFMGFFRDRVAVFFTFLFPLMFLVVFGLIFGDNEASKLPSGVVGDGPIIHALPADAVEVRRFDSLEAGIEKVRSGDVPAVIAEQGDEVVLRFAASDRTGAGTALGLINGV